MDVVTLAMAKRYSDSQRLAYEKWESVTATNDEKTPIPPGGLMGAKVVDYADNRLILTTPERPPETAPENGHLYASGDSYIHYITYNDVLDKKCLVVNGSIVGPYAMDGYSLMYAFEETHDQLGMGVTFTTGWYAVTNSFEYKAVDLADIPVFAIAEELVNGITPGYEDYVKGLFRPCKSFSYTIGEENVTDTANGNCDVLPIPARYDNGENDLSSGWAHARILAMYVSVTVNYNTGFMHLLNLELCSNRSVTICYPVLKQIEQKFLPAVDALILNANGKQYRIYVDETRALVATAIE